MPSSDGALMIEDAHVIFRNFEGREGQYNREGDRSFCIVLESDLADHMQRDGWNIKTLKAREEGDLDRPYIQVAVSYKGRPPQITMITSRGRTDLGEDEVELLDWIELGNVDVVVRPYNWAVNGNTGIKAYLKKIFVTAFEDEFDRKYAEVPMIGATPLARELEAPVGPMVLQGSIIRNELEE